jgi:hypothetical protein
VDGPPSRPTRRPVLLGSPLKAGRRVPMIGVIYEVMAFTEGANKYGAFNWRNKAVRRRVYLEAILRHTVAALAG